MANEISTAGIKVKYAAEGSSGRPTSGFTTIPNVKVTPEISGEPETLEVTDLSDPTWRRYIPSLKDSGGAIAFTANLTAAFITAWETLVTAYATAKASNKKMYFEIVVPGVESFYFYGEPVSLGIDSYDVGSVAEQTAYVVVNGVDGWDTSSS